MFILSIVSCLKQLFYLEYLLLQLKIGIVLDDKVYFHLYPANIDPGIFALDVTQLTLENKWSSGAPKVCLTLVLGEHATNSSNAVFVQCDW